MIRTTLLHSEAARLSFDLTIGLASSGNSSSVSLDNFPGLITILDDFAAVAGFAAERHQQRGRKVEPLTSAKYVQVSTCVLLESHSLGLAPLSLSVANKPSIF